MTEHIAVLLVWAAGILLALKVGETLAGVWTK